MALCGLTMNKHVLMSSIVKWKEIVPCKSALIGWPGLCSRANKQYYFSPIKHDNCTIPHRSPLVSHWAGANTPRLHHWHPVQYRNQRSCRYWKTWPSLYHKTGSTIPANINESNNAGLSSWNLNWEGTGTIYPQHSQETRLNLQRKTEKKPRTLTVFCSVDSLLQLIQPG